MNALLLQAEIDKTQPISRQLYDVLRRRIVDNTLPPGVRLSEANLAKEFDVSRTPLRAALQQLATEGLVTIRPQVGTAVAGLDAEQLRQAVFIRTALERAVVEKLARERSDLSALEPILAQQRVNAEIDDYATFFIQDEAFHAKLADLAGVAPSWKLVQSVKGHVDRQRYKLMSGIPMRSRRAFEEHLLIVEKIREGNVSGASSAMANHVASVLDLNE